jgi:phosphoribosylformimino-5-aminoimidazole carboxamide ribotide isomerase
MTQRKAAFEVIPAIDLLGGEAVRLSQGRYDEATIYDANPARVAERFAKAGIRRLHVVDLEGARAGRPLQGDAVKRILEAVDGLPVQLGGGLRTVEGIDEALGWGLDRVILGTAALREPELVKQAASRHPGQIVVGIDAREGRVAVQGWTDSSETTAIELARRFEDVGVAAIVYTDITRDGMLTGPNLPQTVALASAISIPVVVSGGVSKIEDILESVALADEGICGVIVGRAIYTGNVDLDDALRAVEGI